MFRIGLEASFVGIHCSLEARSMIGPIHVVALNTPTTPYIFSASCLYDDGFGTTQAPPESTFVLFKVDRRGVKTSTVRGCSAQVHRLTNLNLSFTEQQHQHSFFKYETFTHYRCFSHLVGARQSLRTVASRISFVDGKLQPATRRCCCSTSHQIAL